MGPIQASKRLHHLVWNDPQEQFKSLAVKSCLEHPVPVSSNTAIGGKKLLS